MLERPTTFVDTAFTSGANTVRTATEAVTAPAGKVWENLNRRNSQTGKLEGSVAVAKERFLQFMFGLRKGKMRSRPYRARFA